MGIQFEMRRNASKRRQKTRLGCGGGLPTMYLCLSVTLTSVGSPKDRRVYFIGFLGYSPKLVVYIRVSVLPAH
jgi:hypothetical protein